MARKAEDAGGLTPAKDGNAAMHHFTRRTLLFFRCVDYKFMEDNDRFFTAWRRVRSMESPRLFPEKKRERDMLPFSLPLG